jgi:predicted metal-dependent hydrolase
VYDVETRTISIERPARAWTVLHEVAHVLEPGHGADFQRVVIDLATVIEEENG